MATRTWIAQAAATTQVRTWVFAGTWEVGDIIEFAPTGGAVIYSYSVTSTTIATFLPLLVTALNGLSATYYPQLSEMTWSSSSPNLTATGDTPGFPFDITITTRDAGGAADSQTIDGGTSSAGTDSTPCSGPNFASVAANWSGNALPVDTDKVVFDGSTNQPCLFGLDQNAITPANVWVYMTYTGQIGLPDYRTSNNVTYPEYRGKFLKYGNSGDAGNIDFQFGIGNGIGSAMSKFDFGTGRVTGQVFNTGSAGQGNYALHLLGSHANNELNVRKGTVAIAPLASQSANIDILRLSYTSQVQNDVTCYTGPSCTLDDVIKTGGVLTIENAAGLNLQNDKGITTINGSGAPDQITVNGDKVYYNSTGTIGGNPIVNVEGGLDFSQDLRAKTVTNPIESSARWPIRDPNGVLTVPYSIDRNQVDDEFTGRNKRITVEAVA